LHVVDEGVNCETRALFEHWNFYAQNVEEAWDFLNWLAQDTYEFEITCADSHNTLPYIPDFAPPLCEIVIVLTMIVCLVPIIFLIRVLLNLAV